MKPTPTPFPDVASPHAPAPPSGAARRASPATPAKSSAPPTPDGWQALRVHHGAVKSAPRTPPTTTTPNLAGVDPATSPRPPPAVPGDGTVHVRLRSDAQTVLVVPAADVRHAPPPPSPATPSAPTPTALPIPAPQVTTRPAAAAPRRAPLYLCEAFATRGVCPAGAACPDVHAVTANSRTMHEHRRAAAGNERTPRLGPRGLWLMVARVNERESSMLVEASRCLTTLARPEALPPGPWPSTPRGSDEPTAPAPGLCAHFVKKSVCNFGAQCRFVHPLSHPKPICSWKAMPSPPPLPLSNAASPSGGAVTDGPSVTQRPRTAGPRATPPDGTVASAAQQQQRRRYWHNPYGAGWSPLALSASAVLQGAAPGLLPAPVLPPYSTGPSPPNDASV